MGMNNPSSTEFTVFLDTSLDTHLAVTVCGNNTISELIRILESEHQRCLGRIMIRALKVNRKGRWYLLSGNILVRRVVNGGNQEGLLFADALSLEKNEEFQLGSKIEEKENLIEIDTSVEEFNDKQLMFIDKTPEHLLAIGRRDVSRDMTTAAIKDNTSRDVSCDAAVGNKSTFEEPCRASASDLDNRLDSGCHPENDAYKETEVSRNYIESRKDTSEQCMTIVKDASESQPASKKKRKFEEVTGLEDLLKENNSLICDSGVEDFKPEIAFEVAAKKNASTISHVSQSESPSKKKRKFENVSKDRKKNKSLNPLLNQVVDATPARRGDTEAINLKIPRREDVASTGRQGQQENHCTPSQVLQSHHEVPSSLDIDCKKKIRQKKKKKASDFIGDSLVKSGTEHILGSECDITSAEPQEVVQAENGSDKVKGEDNNHSLKNGEDISEKETEGETGSAKKALEETELSQKNDSEAMLIEKHEVPDKSKRDGNDATSKLLNTDGSVTPIKKKKKQKKTNDVNGDYLVLGSEHVDISLAEPHDFAVQVEKGSDIASEEDGNLSLEMVIVVSEKETESSPSVATDVHKLQGNGSNKRKQGDDMTDLHKLQVEKNVSHQDPVLTNDSRTKVQTNRRKKSRLAKTTSIDQSNAKYPKSEKPDGYPLGVKAPTKDGTGSAEKALEVTEPSQKIELEAMPTETHKIPEKSMRDGKDATSELLNTDETITSGMMDRVNQQPQPTQPAGTVLPVGTTTATTTDLRAVRGVPTADLNKKLCKPSSKPLLRTQHSAMDDSMSSKIQASPPPHSNQYPAFLLAHKPPPSSWSSLGLSHPQLHSPSPPPPTSNSASTSNARPIFYTSTTTTTPNFPISQPLDHLKHTTTTTTTTRGRSL